MEIHEKKLKIKLLYVSTSTLVEWNKRMEIRILKKYLHSHVHCAIIHNNQDMETPKCPSVVEWIKKKKCGIGEFPGGLAVKDLVLSLLWLSFDP